MSRLRKITRWKWFRSLSREHQIELITVVLMSLAALASAWSGFQASEWNGVQSSLFFRSSALRAEATHLRTVAYVQANTDAGMLQDWEAAYAAGDQRLMDFYWNRFSDELAVAAEAWLALDPLNNPDAPPSPLDMPGYRIAELVRAAELEAEATRLSDEGEVANTHSGEFVFTTVIFATVLLFSGIATKVSAISARALAIVLSVVFLIIGAVQVIVLPSSF